MRTGRGSWRSGLVVAAVAVVTALVLPAIDPRGAASGLIPTCFVVAVVYAAAALAERRRRGAGDRAESRLGRPLLVGHTGGHRMPVLTRDRVGNALAVVAAVVGLLLVLAGADHHAPPRDDPGQYRTADAARGG